MTNISFNVLGTSAGMPQPDRGNAGYVLDVDGRLIQFDCGGGVSAAFRRAGFDPLAVERIIVSHTHADHISDLPLFIQMIHLAGRDRQLRTSIEVNVPGEALDAIREYLRASYLHPEKLNVLYHLQPVPEDNAIEIEGASILPIRNGHLKGNADLISEYGWKNRMQCYSYLIRVDGKSILYSADLGSETDLFPYLDKLDLLVVESTHIDVARLLEKTVENNVGQVILTHIDEDYDVRGALTIAQKLGIDNFALAHDGMRVEL
jgi:ribonuclease BN (tRNA processing enzyme)